MRNRLTGMGLMLLAGTAMAVTRDAFQIRDPFVLAEGGTYYLYESKPWSGGRGVGGGGTYYLSDTTRWRGGRGVEVRTATDLEHWTEKTHALVLPDEVKCTAVWAPEVHAYDGAYWLFTTLTFDADPARPIQPMLQEGFKGGKLQPRGVWVFRAESPKGPFKPVKTGSVTPRDWMCLDGTLWVEDGVPWMVFCHEWCQTGNGRMMAAPMAKDLSRFTAEPVELFRAADAPGAGHVTDGPFLLRTGNGGLAMIWSNFLKKDGYCVLQCTSASGRVRGPWTGHAPLVRGGGGHGMVFTTFDGRRQLSFHQPNNSPNERMQLRPVHRTATGLVRGREWVLNNGPDARRAIVGGGLGAVRRGLHRFYALGSDVTLTLPMGPADAFEAAELPVFGVRYRITSPQKVGGLFFTTDTLTNLCDRSFTPFPVTCDGTWRTVVRDMRTAKEWKGRVTSFRLDPVNPSESGTEIEISRLGFFPDAAAAERFLAAADDRPGAETAPAVAAARVQGWDRERFQIGAYCLNPPSVRTDEVIRDVKACGIDFLYGVPAGDVRALDLCARHGVGVVASGFFPGWWGGNGERAGKMKDVNPLSTYRLCAKLWSDHPALVAGDIGDEPSALDFPHYGAAIRAIHAENPNVPLYLNLYPNYASVAENTGRQTLNQLGTPTYREHIAEYCKHVPLHYISYDFYPYMNTDRANDTFRLKMWDNFQIVAEACRATDRDFWYIPQVNSRYEDRHMTENTLRFQAHAAMAFGAVSITWACYTPGWWKNNVIRPDGTKNVEYARLRTVNAELKTLAGRYMRYRNVATHFVGFPASEKLGTIGIAVKDALSCGPFRDVRAADGAPLLVGEMTARTGGAKALFVLAADDMYDAHPVVHEVRVRAKGVRVSGGAGEVKAAAGADGTVRVPLASNAAVLIEAE